ncbi:MAG TPA: hypothetical protein VFW65_13440 [Pseudonocardiaceae bacterium]|nr:hypothetical protein [Pseudonocardiaceae bacterium]
MIQFDVPATSTSITVLFTFLDAITGQPLGRTTSGPLAAAQPQVLRAGYAARSKEPANGDSALVGINPANGQQIWTSPTLPPAVVVAEGDGNVYQISCTPWQNQHVCASVTLVAMAA